MSSPELIDSEVEVGTPVIFGDKFPNMKDMNEHCFSSRGGTLAIEWKTKGGTYVTLVPATGDWLTPNTWQSQGIESFRLTATGSSCFVTASSTVNGEK